MVTIEGDMDEQQYLEILSRITDLEFLEMAGQDHSEEIKELKEQIEEA